MALGRYIIKLLPSSSKELEQRAGTGLKKALLIVVQEDRGSPGKQQGTQHRGAGGSRQAKIEGKIATHWHSTYFSNIKANGESVNKLTI